MGLDNYHLFLIPGFLAWNFTLSAVVSASESIIQSKHLISKIAFPNEILVLVNIAVCFVDFLVSVIIYLVVIFLTGALQSSNLFLLLPAVIFLQILFTTGLGLFVATISVYFRDVPKLVQLAGTIMFFFTPVFYPLTNVPVAYQWILKLNPMTHIIGFYHDILYYNQVPDKIYALIMVLTFAVIFLAGVIVFNNFKHKFAELS
jgi:ABC-type polysaccharide/polyol phosphate export permease